MKSGAQYAREVRALREAGIESFPASKGYVLSEAPRWSRGQKAAVTRAFNLLAQAADEADEEETLRQANEELAQQFFEDAAGDEFEEWDDINFFDETEAELLLDDEADDYEENPQ